MCSLLGRLEHIVLEHDAVDDRPVGGFVKDASHSISVLDDGGRGHGAQAGWDVGGCVTANFLHDVRPDACLVVWQGWLIEFRKAPAIQ